MVETGINHLNLIWAWDLDYMAESCIPEISAVIDVVRHRGYALSDEEVGYQFRWLIIKTQKEST